MLYELTVDQKHISLIKKALQSYLCSIYDALDEEVVDVDKAHEDIRVLIDMLAVLKGQSNYKQTSKSVGLIWCKQINLDEQYQNELDSFVEYSEMCLDTFFKNQQIGGK